MGNDPKTSANNNPLDRALARWEGEGGSLDADWEKRAALIQEEERILLCLGAAVITRWNNLPVEVQRLKPRPSSKEIRRSGVIDLRTGTAG